MGGAAGREEGLAERLHYRAHLAPSHLTKVDGPSALAGAARLMLGGSGWGIKAAGKRDKMSFGSTRVITTKGWRWG